MFLNVSHSMFFLLFFRNPGAYVSAFDDLRRDAHELRVSTKITLNAHFFEHLESQNRLKTQLAFF